MASTAIPSNPTTHHVLLLLPKLYEADSDFRYMALNDLYHILDVASPNLLLHEYGTCARTIDGLIHTLNDSNGEVQNMAVKCLGPFVNKVPENVLLPMIDKIAKMQTGNVVDKSVPALALRAVVVALPRPVQGSYRSKSVQEAYSAVHNVLIPRLVGCDVIGFPRKDQQGQFKGMIEYDIESGTDSNAMDVLIEVIRCFGPMLLDTEKEALQKTSFEVIESDITGSVLKKKAVVAISTLSGFLSDSLLSALISRLIEFLRNPHLNNPKRKIYITLLGAICRSIPRKFGPYLKTLAPFVFGAIAIDNMGQERTNMVEEEHSGEDEVREAALTTIEAFLAFCSQNMRPYFEDCINVSTIYLKYDPNLAEDIGDGESDENDENEHESNSDDDFEEEEDYDDDDDLSWKIRRCAAKVLNSIIISRINDDSLDDAVLYNRVAPVLVSRLKEREENVKLEILTALSCLIRKSAEQAGFAGGKPVQQDTKLPLSRKRRRGFSDTSMIDVQAHGKFSSGFYVDYRRAEATTEPQTSLAKLSSELVRKSSQLLKSTSLPIKQATITLLKDVILAQHGGLNTSMDETIASVMQIIEGNVQHSSSSGGTASLSVTGVTLRIAALQLISAIFEWNPLHSFKQKLPQLIFVLTKSVQERYSKVALESLIAIEQVVISLLPTHAASNIEFDPKLIKDLYDVLTSLIKAGDTDLEVKRSAIHALALILGHASGNVCLDHTRREEGMGLLFDRLRNELTRLASVRGIGLLCSMAHRETDYDVSWIRAVCLELGSQFRKASRALRSESLQSLKILIDNKICLNLIDEQTTKEIVAASLTLLTGPDLHLISPSLMLLAVLANAQPQSVMSKNFIGVLCSIMTEPVAGSALDSLLCLIRSLGEKKVGGQLMAALVKDVGISGNPDLLGKVIGTLLVAGGNDVGVTVEDFVGELKTAVDEKRKCLSLVVLGEVGLRLHQSFPLEPQFFIAFLSSPSDRVPLAAAVALGRAGAGNVHMYLPAILETLGASSEHQYLLLHSISEVLQHNETEADIIPYAEGLWKHLLSSAQSDDNKVIGAECIGRLAIIEPNTYLPQLQNFLVDPKPGVRGMVISALRYTLAETDEQLDDKLRPTVAGMLTTMLNETDLENRRLALTTLSSAARNKPYLLLPHLAQLVPLAMKETVIRPDLLREVQMGPFKHKVDDGLEVRKSAYETLYTLLETFFPLFPLPPFYDHVISGISDEHDIRTISNLIVTKLIQLSPEETYRRLDTLSDAFRKVLTTRPKENAVKTEIERIHESYRGVVKVSLAVQKKFGVGVESGMGILYGTVDDPLITAWRNYWEWVKKEFAPQLKLEEEESKEKER